MRLRYGISCPGALSSLQVIKKNVGVAQPAELPHTSITPSATAPGPVPAAVLIFTFPLAGVKKLNQISPAEDPPHEPGGTSVVLVAPVQLYGFEGVQYDPVCTISGIAPHGSSLGGWAIQLQKRITANASAGAFFIAVSLIIQGKQGI